MSKKRPPRLESDPPWMDPGAGPPARGPGSVPPRDPDAELWKLVASGVKPLAKARHGPDARSPNEEGSKRGAGGPERKPTGAANRSAPTPPSPSRPKIAVPPPRSHGVAHGVDARTLTKLRRGLIPIEAEIDLHGMTQERAQSALMRFVSSHQAAGRRCLRVVTGRGLKRDWSVGVLREAVPRWFNEPPLAGLVLAFAYAARDDGGSGALYVLLKRKRS